jgi:hypothetical protein
VSGSEEACTLARRVAAAAGGGDRAARWTIMIDS